MLLCISSNGSLPKFFPAENPLRTDASATGFIVLTTSAPLASGPAHPNITSAVNTTQLFPTVNIPDRYD